MTNLAPRLRVERLVIVESSPPVTFIRDVQLRAGLNIVWAEELTSAEGATEVERAGHGVGKSTFSLMLRSRARRRWRGGEDHAEPFLAELLRQRRDRC